MDSRHDWYNEEKVVSSIQCVIACAALHQQSYASCAIVFDFHSITPTDKLYP